MGEVIAAHAVMFLEVADDRLDGGPPLNSRLIGGVMRRFWLVLDLELVIGRGIVAAIAGIGDEAIEPLPMIASICGMTVPSVCPS